MFPQDGQKSEARYYRDDNHKCEKPKLNAPKCKYDQRCNEEGDGDILFNMPHKKYRTASEFKKLWNRKLCPECNKHIKG